MGWRINFQGGWVRREYTVRLNKQLILITIGNKLKKNKTIKRNFNTQSMRNLNVAQKTKRYSKTRYLTDRSKEQKGPLKHTSTPSFGQENVDILNI